MTTFLFFSELLVNTSEPSESTDILYDCIIENSKQWYYTKWDECS